MQFWELKCDVENYATIEFANGAERDALFGKFLGYRLPQPWPDIHVFYDDESKDKNLTTAHRKFAQKYKGLPKGDFPVLPIAAPVFGERAFEVLAPLVKNSVEFIPLICDGEKLYLVNVIDMLDCLDQERSTIKRFSNGSISHVLHYEFTNTALLTGKGIFKLIGKPVTVFVTDAFKKLIDEYELKGLMWKPLP
jgi:hypothetical protein